METGRETGRETVARGEGNPFLLHADAERDPEA